MSSDSPLVIALDDHRPILASLGCLLGSRGYQVRLHDKPEDFFAAGPPDPPACLLLDHELGSTTGVAVHAEMRQLGWQLPTVFLTAHARIPLAVETLRAGADGFLVKPYDPEDLINEIERALDHSRTLAEHEARNAKLRRLASKLSPREREIVTLVVAGNLNKEIADKLDLALVTVKVHRSRAMQKLGAGNPAELTRIAIAAGIVPPR